MTAAAQTAPIAETWPLSPEQRAASGFGEAFVLQLDVADSLDETRLKASLAEAAARHDALSTAFVAVPGYRGVRRSQLDRPTEPEWIVRDLRGRSSAEDEIAEDLKTLRNAPFDLARGATLRAAIWLIEDDRWRLAIAASPLVADKTTLALIVDALQRGVGASDAESGTYAQYADWRLEMETDEDADEARRYWRDHIADAPPAPALNYRGAAQGGRRIERGIAVDPAIAARFAEVEGKAGVEIGLLAAWLALLGRLTDARSLFVGWRHDCRQDYEMFAGVAGPFEKVLPVKVSYDPEAPFAHHLGRLAETLGAHLDWQEHLPLDGAESAQGIRVGFGLGASPTLTDGWTRLSLDGPCPFELELRPEIDASGALSALTLACDEGRYGAAAAETLLEQAITLLAAIGAEPATPLGALPIVGPRERARMAELDRADVAPQALAPLLREILGWAERTPQAAALADGATTLDYAMLANRVETVARALAARGVKPEAVVALDIPRSIDMVVALLAVWRAGGAYLPLDPDWPAARRRQLSEAAGAVLVVHDGAGRPQLGDFPTLAIADAYEGAATAQLPDIDAPADRAAYVLFTSGSTGAPKGVVVEHGQLASYVAAVRDALALDERRRFALTSTVAADLGNTALFGALAGGACLYVASDVEVRDPAAFAAFLRGGAIDCAKLAPSHLAALLEGESAAVPATLVLGGEAVPQALVARVLAIDPACRIFNHYGPTETTVGVLIHPCRSSDDGMVPLTRALDGNAVVLLDERARPTPTGAVGQVHIGGAQICRGYLGAEGAGFVDDPSTPGRKLYPTGDLARHRPEGGIEIVGRADSQAKINGHRVEPGEIEATLGALPGVRQAALDVRRDAEGLASLVAFVVGDAGESALRAELATRLPAPMVPARIALIDRMPLLPNGKIDRSALAARGLDEVPAGVAPRDELETALRDLAAELLGRSPDAFGVTDDFFDLGGNSLLVIKFVARIRKLFGLELAPGIVFDHPSVAALAGALRAEGPGGDLDRIARLRTKLAGLSDEERAALLAGAAGERPSS